MSSREDILQNIRRNTRVRYERPDLAELEENALTYPDKVAQFCAIMKQMGGEAVVLGKEMGGEAVVLGKEDDLNEIIREKYPQAKRVASNMKEVATGEKIQLITCATFHPDDVASPAELDGTDLAIVDGRIGVCENGAVWLQQDVEQRAIYFISEALVILLDRKNLVNNMHEAYKRIDTGEYGYGVFMSGPSKTADIEQALVMGAHGPRSVTVILL